MCQISATKLEITVMSESFIQNIYKTFKHFFWPSVIFEGHQIYYTIGRHSVSFTDIFKKKTYSRDLLPCTPLDHHQ